MNCIRNFNSFAQAKNYENSVREGYQNNGMGRNTPHQYNPHQYYQDKNILERPKNFQNIKRVGHQQRFYRPNTRIGRSMQDNHHPYYQDNNSLYRATNFENSICEDYQQQLYRQDNGISRNIQDNYHQCYQNYNIDRPNGGQESPRAGSKYSSIKQKGNSSEIHRREGSRLKMKPFRNREYANARRAAQRLSKLPYESLDERQRNRLKNVREIVDWHKQNKTTFNPLIRKKEFEEKYSLNMKEEIVEDDDANVTT